MWKNDKRKFEEFLVFVFKYKVEIKNHSIINEIFVFSLKVMSFESFKRSSIDDSWKMIYRLFYWYEKVYFFLKKTLEKSIVRLMIKAFNYRIIKSIFWIHREKFYLFCISKRKILNVLKKIHDNANHWVKTDTIIKIRKTCYWFDQSQNVERYIIDCIKCTRHESITKSQSLNLVLMSFSFQLLRINFINFLPVTKFENIYILNIVCYFNRFIISFVRSTTNVKNVIWFLRLYILIYKKSLIFYCDENQHFDNEELKTYLKFKKIIIDYNFFDLFKNIEIIEMSNKLLKKIFKKK